jgi:hypothetical protein
MSEYREELGGKTLWGLVCMMQPRFNVRSKYDAREGQD